MELREAANRIIKAAIRSAMPDEAVFKALKGRTFNGPLHIVSIGKAAWQMAKAAADCLEIPAVDGIVITKYGHAMGPIGNLKIREAGHPVPDSNSYEATREAMALVSGLTERDTVLFLVSGGGSALFESPLVSEEEMADITAQLLACGADIREINAIRKRLSAVKGGRFGALCSPARVLSIVLSDIIGDPLDMIASGPAAPDTSTVEQVTEIIRRYDLKLTEKAVSLLGQPLPDDLSHVETTVTGSVKQLCAAAVEECTAMGYEPHVLTASLTCTARDAGSFLASIAEYHCTSERPTAYILGGETVVRLTGHGKGGRNQEIALSAAHGIAGMSNVAVFSVGSDGTDGPTDAAGGYADGNTEAALSAAGHSVSEMLNDNDAYHALEKTGGLIITGPTGTNVNDLTVLLINAR